MASEPWRCCRLRTGKLRQHIEVSVDASPEDLISYYLLSEEGRGAVLAAKAAGRLAKNDSDLKEAVRKVNSEVN